MPIKSIQIKNDSESLKKKAQLAVMYPLRSSYEGLFSKERWSD